MYEYKPLTSSNYEFLKTFSFLGKEYRINAVVKPKANVKFGQRVEPAMVQLVKHIVRDGCHHSWEYALWYKTGTIIGYLSDKPPETFIESIILDGKEHFDTTLSYCCTREKFDEVWDSLVQSFAVYLFIMIALALLRDRWTGWIIVTCLFVFWCRKLCRTLNHYQYGFDYGKMLNTLNSMNPSWHTAYLDHTERKSS